MRTPSLLAEARVTGHLSGSTTIQGALSLTPSSRAAFQAYANAVSDPSSPVYHRFLSPAQIGARFGASASTVNAATAYLKSKGLTITMIADNRMAILFRGRADKIESTFSTRLNTYSAPSRKDGPTTFYSYNSAPKVPSTFAASVTSVSGLQNAYKPLPKMPLTPSQTRQLYNAAPLFNRGRFGAGINVGVSNFDGYQLSNATKFYSLYYPGFGTPNITKVNVGGDGELSAAVGEADLDFQMILAVAPKAHIFMYDDPVTGDFVSVRARIAQDNIVDVVTESWGFTTTEDTRPFIQAAHDQQVALTAQGITFVCASGDYGTDLAAGKGGDSFAYPDFDPEILSIGGTTGTVDAEGNRITEDGWVGSGSGFFDFDFDFNVLPSYQKGNGVPTDINRRLFPDIAVRAWGTNKLFEQSGLTDGAYLVFEQGLLTQYQGGGTSAAAPCFAGQLALILEDLTAEGAGDTASNGRVRLGRLNDFIYGLNGDPSVFYDVTTGDTGKLPNGDEAIGKVGWDFVTGWGAPNTSGLLSALLATTSVPQTANAVSASIFGGFGTDLQGAATDPDTGVVDSLVVSEGSPLTLQTVKKPGLGQVAATSVDIRLGAPNRRSASLKVAMSSPALTTGYVYFYDFTTGKFDDAQANVRIVTGNGGMSTVNIPIALAADGTSPYIGTVNGTETVRILVRAIKPQRLGSAPFGLVVDQATVIERVPRS